MSDKTIFAGKKRGERGVIKKHMAQNLRDQAKTRNPGGFPDPVLMREARLMEEEARQDLAPVAPPVACVGGEVIPMEDGPKDPYLWALRNTLEDGDQVSLDASRQRMELANSAGVLALALDAADTIRAENSLEKALAHQMATAHDLAMKLMHKATDSLTAYPRQDTSDMQRLVNSASRLMATFQQGLATIQRLRTGGKQEVQVTHVHQQVQVNGGQVAVAGSLRAGGMEGGCHVEK